MKRHSTSLIIQLQFSRSVLSDSAPPWTAACQASLSITNSQSLLKLMSIESVMPSIQPSHPLLSLPPPAFKLPQHQIRSDQISCSVSSDSLWPHGLQHVRIPCPSPSPGACSNSCLLSRWCHPTISSFVVRFSSSLQSFPVSGSFPMTQFFTSGGQSIGVSASASVLPMNIQDWFPLGWTGWIFLESKGLSRVFSNTTVQKHQFFGTQLSYPYMTTGKTIALTRLLLAK